MSADKIVDLATTGVLALENGRLVCRDLNGRRIGQIYVGPNGKLVIDGIEVLGIQKDDPWKLQGASSYGPTGDRAALVVSSGKLRIDGVVEETGYLKLGQAEDAGPGEYRGQIEVYLRLDNLSDPQLVAVATSAYSQERAWIDVVPGARTLYVAVKYLLDNLWKFNTQPVLTPVPIPVPPPPPPPDPVDPILVAKVQYFTGPDGRLDFQKIAAYYSFASDDEQHYLDGDMTATDVIVEMDRRAAPKTDADA